VIVFDLRCAPEGHVFEAWFGSSDDYEAQRARGLVSCPLCGSQELDKAVMAPRVGAKGNQRLAGARAASDMVSSDPEGVKAMLSAMASAQKEMLARSEHVGDRFAEEARRIHFGEVERRSIHGRATPDETASLADDGIEVAPLPFPVVEPGEEN
jgi:hypothetical protein